MSYYRSIARHTIGSSTGQALARYAASLSAAGVKLPKDIQQATDDVWANLAKLKEIRAEANPAAHVREVENKLANGTATVSDIMGAANAGSLTTNDPNSHMARMFSNAETIISKQAHKVFASHGDKWITHTLRPLVNKHVATILEAAPETLRVDPREDPNQCSFLLHIPAVAEAWGSLSSIYQVTRELRSQNVMPSTYQRSDCYEFAGDPAERDAMQDTNITWFVWAARNGHTPGIYTEADNHHYWN